jgi:hypothetical protein
VRACTGGAARELRLARGGGLHRSAVRRGGGSRLPPRLAHRVEMTPGLIELTRAQRCPRQPRPPARAARWPAWPGRRPHVGHRPLPAPPPDGPAAPRRAWSPAPAPAPPGTRRPWFDRPLPHRSAAIASHDDERRLLGDGRGPCVSRTRIPPGTGWATPQRGRGSAAAHREASGGHPPSAPETRSRRRRATPAARRPAHEARGDSQRLEASAGPVPYEVRSRSCCRLVRMVASWG